MKLGPITIGQPDPIAETIRALENQTISAGQANASLELMQERMAELEFALEDQGWERLSSESNCEFTRDALRRIMNLSRMAFLKNPLINRAVTLQAFYVWGQGINIQAKDDEVNAVVQAFLDDPANLTEFTGHQSRIMKEIDLQTLGNIFFVFFTDQQENVKLRTIPADEVVDIICNPEDAKERWYYRRSWKVRALDGSLEEREAYYPDWRYEPPLRTATFNGKEIRWESPVYHMKVGGMSDMRFGVPETYAALDWSTAYKNFLEDWATIVRSLSRFAWKMTAPGGQSKVAEAKARLQSTLGLAGGAETNPAPIAGSTFIASGGADMQPIKTSGATVAAEDGRRLLLMVAAATGLPETFFGDASVGTLATAKSLDRPTELKMQARQTLWKDALVDIIEYAVFKKMPMKDDDERWQIDVNFPPILEHDVTESVGAIVSAATLNGNPPLGTVPMELLVKMLLNALGVDDVDEIVDSMDALPQVPDPNTEPPAPQEQQQAMERYFKAQDELKRMIQEAQKA